MNPRIDLSGIPQVTDAATAEQFLRWCCRANGPAFHPDTPFGDYEQPDGTRTFTDDEAILLDAQLTAAFRLVPDPYAVCLEEFAAMRAGPPPTAEPGPAEGTTGLAKVILTHRTNQTDPVLAGFEAARWQLHVREARATPGLAVVLVPVGQDPHIDTVAVSGGLDHVLDWIRTLSEMEAARFWYDIELPPAARDQGDEDMWAGWFSERLDQPGINFSVHVCDNDEEWRAGLP